MGQTEVDSRFNTLVALLGGSPAVLTETLYALIKGDSDLGRRVPDKILVVTTAFGRRCLEEELLTPCVQHGLDLQDRWDRLEQLLGPGLVLPRPDVVVPRSEGVEIEDAYYQHELDAMADELMDQVRAVTADRSSVMFLSLSGGKKGMSSLAGQMMSLFARPQDRLIHVAVAPRGLEACSQFYFPDPQDGEYSWTDTTNDMTARVSYQGIELSLSHQAYLPLRSVLDRASHLPPLGELSFRELASMLLPDSEPPPMELRISIEERTATLAGKMLQVSRKSGQDPKPLQPAELGYLVLLASRGDTGVPVPMTDEDCIELLRHVETLRQRDDSVDDYKRWDLCFPLFPLLKDGFTRRSLDSILLSPFDLAGVSSALHLLSEVTAAGDHERRVEIERARTKRQAELTTKLNQALRTAAPRVLPEQVQIPTGRPGRGNAARNHRLPHQFRCVCD